MAAGTPKGATPQKSPRAMYELLSEVVRLLVLRKHGGIYCDVDTVLLRDLSPLAHLMPFASNRSACHAGGCHAGGRRGRGR